MVLFRSYPQHRKEPHTCSKTYNHRLGLGFPAVEYSSGLGFAQCDASTWHPLFLFRDLRQALKSFGIKTQSSIKYHPTSTELRKVRRSMPRTFRGCDLLQICGRHLPDAPDLHRSSQRSHKRAGIVGAYRFENGCKSLLRMFYINRRSNTQYSMGKQNWTGRTT